MFIRGIGPGLIRLERQRVERKRELREKGDKKKDREREWEILRKGTRDRERERKRVKKREVEIES